MNGIAAMSASGGYGTTRVCAGIIGFADLTLGADVGPVLDAHQALSPRFRGIRHATGWDASDAVRNSHTNPSQHLLQDASFRQGIAELEKRGLSFDAWLYHPQLPELVELAQDFPGLTIVADHFCGPLSIGPYSDSRQSIYLQCKRTSLPCLSAPMCMRNWAVSPCPSMALAGIAETLQPRPMNW